MEGKFDHNTLLVDVSSSVFGLRIIYKSISKVILVLRDLNAMNIEPYVQRRSLTTKQNKKSYQFPKVTFIIICFKRLTWGELNELASMHNFLCF